MVDTTVAGLSIADGLPDGSVPLSAVVVVKALGADGREEYLTRATDGLSTVEALGMAQLLVIRLSAVLAGEGEEP